MQRFGVAERHSYVTIGGYQLSVGDEVSSRSATRRTVEDVHARYGQQLWGFARRLGLADDEANDVVQEALLRLWRAVGAGRPVEQPAAWAFRTTYRLAMDRHRLRRRWQAYVDAHRLNARGLIERPLAF